MKFTAKQMERLAKKCSKQEEEAKLKVKKVMEKGDAVSARIYAQDAIRIKNTGTNYLRLASRIDACASRVESAIKMQQVTKQMGQVTKGMDKVLASMDVNQISKVMDQFEGARAPAPRAVGCFLLRSHAPLRAPSPQRNSTTSTCARNTLRGR